MYPKIAKIELQFIAENDKNYNKLRNNLCQFKEIFQYIYSMVYPEIHCTTECRGFDLKSTFQLIFETYKDKKKFEQLGKDSNVFLRDRNEHFNKKLLKLTISITQKRKKFPKKLKKEKKRREIAEKNKSLKQKKN